MSAGGEDFLERYDRQIRLFGREGQERISSSTVLVAGAGGLGSNIIYHLAGLGVGRLLIIDEGRVELSNLNRQLLYTVDDIGRLKAVVAAERVRRLNPGVEAVAYPEKITPGLMDRLAAEADVVVDALDNWETRQIVNEAAVKHRKPLVHGGVNGYYGQVMVVKPCETPCLACIFPSKSRGETIPVVSPVVGLVASIQAVETMKLLLGLETLEGLLTIDARRMVFEKIRVERNPRCPVCGRYCGGESRGALGSAETS